MAILTLVALVASPALYAASVCPTPVSLTNSGADGNSNGFGLATSYLNDITSAANSSCNVLITIAANGSISTSNPNGAGFYDTGDDDNVVGVINNSSTTITSLNLSSSTFDIFGFDGDGIDTSPYNAPGNSMDSTGYGGPDSFFTNISPDSTTGIVNFVTPLAANGGMTYFSLEESFDATNPPTPVPPAPTAATPEPGSLVLLGTGLLGFAGAIRRRMGR